MPETADDLVEVRLIGLPMGPFLAAREHGDGLMREFRLISLSDPEVMDVPQRLIQLADDLQRRFGAFGAGAETVIAEAEVTGAATVDLSLRVPQAVAEATAEYGALLDEADRYCAAGEHLLTLVTPPDALALRRWFLEEFTRQIGGQPPRPWAEYRASSAG